VEYAVLKEKLYIFFLSRVFIQCQLITIMLQEFLLTYLLLC